MKPKSNPFLRTLAVTASVFLCGAMSSTAALVYWDTNGNAAGSGAATGTWGTDTFWTTTEAGTVATNGNLPIADDDVFIAAGNNGTAGTITIDGAKVAGSITIQEPAASPGVTISGGTSLTLGGGASVNKGLFVTGNAAHTVSTPLILSGANTIQTGGTGTFTINGGITGTGDLTLRHNSTSSDTTGIRILASQVNITGAISNTGTNSGTVFIGNAVSTTGTGGLGANVTSVSQDSTTSPLHFINANNSAYAGNYNINAGTLQFAGTNTGPGTGTNLGTITATNAASVINLGGTTGTSAATLNIVNNAVSGKVNNNINVRAGSTGTKSMTVNSSVSFGTSGEVTLDDNLTLSGPSANFGISLNGIVKDGVSGPRGLIKTGAGDATLTAANTYSGTTSVTAGLFSLSGASGSLASSATGVSITGGTFRLNNTAAANNTNRVPDSTVINVNGGTLNFNHNAGAANYSETVAVHAGSTGTISTSQAAASQTSALTIGTLTRTPGATLVFSGTGLGVDDRNRVFFTTSPAVNDLIPWATVGTTNFAGYDPVDGVYNYTAAVDIDALGSTITDDSTSNLRISLDGTGSPIALGSTVTSINTLVQANTTLASTPTIDTAGKTLRMNALLIPSTANTRGLTIGAAPGDGTLTAGSAGGELFLNNYSANALTLNAVIANNTSPSSVSKAGSGSATFAAANTYTGGTNISGGIVTAANAAALGAGTVTINPGATRLVINDSLTLANNITFRGGGVTSRGVFENSGTGEATLSGTITIDGPISGGGHFASATGGTLRVTGAINSAVQPVTARIGTVIFSGGGTYSNFILNEGTARLGANNGLSTSATVDLAASNAGSLDLNGFSQTLVGITRTANQAATIGNGSNTSDSVLTTTGTSTYPGNIANVIGTPTTPRTTSLVVNSGNLTLTGGFTAQNITINNTGTLTIGAGGGDGINPVSKLISINSGGTLRYTGDNRIQNDTVIDIATGATLNMNGRTDVVGHIRGGGNITNLTNTLTFALPAAGSPAEFSGTISGAATGITTLVLRGDGTGASAASTLILSGDNSGLATTGTNSSVNVQGGRLIGRHPAAFGAAGQIISVGAAALTLDPTIEYGSDTPLNNYVINMASGITGTIELNRATSGPAFTQTASTPTLGNSVLNIEKGANVATGTPVLQLPAISLAGGITGLGAVTLNPIGVDISVTGGVTRPGAAANNLRLGGTSTGNIIAGAIQNGTAPLIVTKQDTSTWTLSGTNSYTGTTTVNGGSLHLTGSLAAASAVTVGGAAATGTPTLSGTGTVNGTLTVAAAGGGAAGIVNPGTVGTAGTLNAGATTIAGTYACDVVSASADRLAVTGDLNISGATLALNAVTPTPGTYTIATYTGSLTGTFTPDPALPSGYSLDYATAGEIKLTIAGTTPPYESWGAAYGLAAGSEGGDLDNDGMSNFEEFAFGLIPNNGSSVNPITVQLNKTSGQFTYQRLATSDLSYTIWTSPDLVTWTQDTTAVQTAGTPDGNNVQSVAVTLTGAPLTAGRLFVRVKAD